MLTIGEFWRERLNVKPIHGGKAVSGWHFQNSGIATFQEAPLAVSGEAGMDGDPSIASVILVSAPGAVGKSTLAQQIAHETGAVYIDLAKADPVGGNTLSGGLLRSNIHATWAEGTTAVLIDGLDEARLRVTQASFEAFLADVAEVSKGRTVPTVLFGRTGAVQDAWLILSQYLNTIPVLEIGFYDAHNSIKFAEAVIAQRLTEDAHSTPRRRALEMLLNGLRQQTESDGDRFAGYAPVLNAVAERVATETNPSALISQIEGGEETVTLQAVVDAILERERGKLDSLPFEDQMIASRLYSGAEQIRRLAAQVYGFPPPELPAMTPNDTATYAAALETWVSEHPFLNGARAPSSAVFDAVICAAALTDAAMMESARNREIERGAAANPFLSEFYPSNRNGEGSRRIPPEHIGIVYSSMRARLSLGDSASLSVDGSDDATDTALLAADVEISIQRRGAERAQSFHFDSEQVGALILGKSVEDVEITAPLAKVIIGPGDEAIFVSPVSIQCQHLSFTTSRLIVESPSHQSTASAFLQAEKFDGPLLTTVPTLRGHATLAVAWPGATSHPWTSFSTTPTSDDDPRVDEGLRRLRKFVIAFRSHSKGALKRFRAKLEHARMTKGAGQAVLNQLVREGVLHLDGPMYVLDPQKLGSIVGTTYADSMAFAFGPSTISFVKRAIGTEP